MLTPVDNPSAYGLVETDERGNIQRFLEKLNADETPATPSTPASTFSSWTPRSIPKDTPWSIERVSFSVAHECRETFIAYVYRGY